MASASISSRCRLTMWPAAAVGIHDDAVDAVEYFGIFGPAVTIDFRLDRQAGIVERLRQQPGACPVIVRAVAMARLAGEEQAPFVFDHCPLVDCAAACEVAAFWRKATCTRATSPM